jgi:hypothetical protein
MIDLTRNIIMIRKLIFFKILSWQKPHFPYNTGVAIGNKKDNGMMTWYVAYSVEY